MTISDKNRIELTENGFTTVGNIYSDQEIEQILMTIEQADTTKETFTPWQVSSPDTI